MAFVLMPLLCQTAFAQSAQTNSGKSEIADYVRGKFKVRHIHSQLQKTEHGPSGSIYVIGDLTPTGIGAAAMKTEKSDRAREIAKALILADPEIFGSINPNELREGSLETDQNGHIHIRYRRHIGNLPLDGAEVVVHIGPDERISSISAQIKPVSPELYRAVETETLREEDLLSIIEEDLKAGNATYKSIRIKRSQKLAVSASPYILWQVDVNTEDTMGSWVYRIDAFTGMVIEKRSALIE
jgi:Zn-dependent metalloprotease